MNQPRGRQVNHSSSFSYMDEIQYTLVELDKAVKNLNMMSETAQKIGLFDLLRSPGSFAQKTQNQWASILQSIDTKQIAAFLQSPMIQKMLTDPEFYKLFAPDTGTTPGTGSELNREQEQGTENAPPSGSSVSGIRRASRRRRY